jgi:hypothetical protein
VIDLWKSRPPVAAADFRSARQLGGGCLTLTSFSVAEGNVSAAGREQNLFEHSFLVAVRAANGRIVASQPVTAEGGWRVKFPYRVPQHQAGTLEAASGSAKDGSLACLAQLRVTLVPRP